MATITKASYIHRLRKHIPTLHNTSLSDDVEKLSQKIPVFDLPSLSVGTYYAIVGNIGEDRTEVLSFTEYNDTSFDAQNRYSHKKYTSVVITNVYKARIYVADTEDGTYTQLDEEELEYQSPDGILFKNLTLDSTKFYKVVYVANTEDGDQEITSLSSVTAIQIDSLGIKDTYATIEDVLGEAGEQYREYPSNQIWGYIRTAKNKINSTLTFVGVEVPLSPVPEEIRYLTRTLATAYLLRANREYEGALALEDYVMKKLQGLKDGTEIIDGISIPSKILYSPDANDIRLASLDQQW